MSPDSVSQAPANPQTLNRYTYVLNNPVLHTDPSGHCIPGIGSCQWTGQLNVADGAAFARGVGEGVLSVVAGVVTAPIAAAEAVVNPGAAVAGIQDAAATVARGADFAWNHAGEATAIVNENPEALGHILGEALGTAAMAKLLPGESGCSFDADTPVATDHGLVAIGALHIGDTVLAYNEDTQTTESYPITRVWVNLDRVVEHLTVANEQLETTPEHPFFVLLRGWVAAGDLQKGDSVRRVDGNYGAVTAITLERRTAVMYNLTVDTAHTYFVGEQRWLVHNACNASRKLGDLEPLHAPGMNPTTANKLRGMTDEGLIKTVTNPADGQNLKVRPGENVTIDGNTRLREMQRRMQANPRGPFRKDLDIPVEEIPRYNPDS